MRILLASGMVMYLTKAQYKSFLNSFEWKQVRSKCLQRSKHGDDNIVIGRCEQCGYIAWQSRSLQCHHKSYDVPPGKSLESVLLDMGNIEVLCANCHKLRHKVTN